MENRAEAAEKEKSRLQALLESSKDKERVLDDIRIRLE